METVNIKSRKVVKFYSATITNNACNFHCAILKIFPQKAEKVWVTFKNGTISASISSGTVEVHYHRVAKTNKLYVCTISDLI